MLLDQLVNKPSIYSTVYTLELQTTHTLCIADVPSYAYCKHILSHSSAVSCNIRSLTNFVLGPLYDT